VPINALASIKGVTVRLFSLPHRYANRPHPLAPPLHPPSRTPARIAPRETRRGGAARVSAPRGRGDVLPQGENPA